LYCGFVLRTIQHVNAAALRVIVLRLERLATSP
jgi:hypothetical protein